MKTQSGSDCGEDGEADNLSKVYKKDPSIENYLRLRRAYPGTQIEVGVIGGIEQIFYMEEELKKYGIETETVLGVMDADLRSVNELALQLLERIAQARSLAKAGETHLIRRGLALPDKLIDWLITCSLDAMSWNDELEISRDLIVLIRERLGGSWPEYEQASWAHEQKGQAAMIGGQLKAQGITPTLKILAGALGVAPSTVKRWFKDDELRLAIDRWARLFDGKGNLLPLTKP